ncbi:MULTISPECIES: hypothetical protein [Acinetobacter]|uniref:hypothetical protein n=1 Tax=Acinetobacter TaxID=469 RepID=UPI000EA15321|nr:MULTISPECIES: hypothetical protein [Acinetobacter]RKG40667.1 hypothetical protein D7V51_14815 [Acinetobacter cumulans]RZG56905.1 hypothetical protein EXE29_14720 [Acinetobacter sp. WCHAc060006]
MNVLEKAQLLKELHDLLNHLENRSLNFFEIAKSKNRIKQIFKLCDEPIFHKQQAEFKRRSEPKASAIEFAQKSAYALSFVGYFEQEDALLEQFGSQHQLGWGLLHHSNASWKVIVYTPQLTQPWQSPWGTLEQSFAVMQTQHTEHGLLTDEALLHAQQILPLDSVVSHEIVIENTSPYCFDEVIITETDPSDNHPISVNSDSNTAEAEEISLYADVPTQTEFGVNTPLIPDPIIEFKPTPIEELTPMPVVEVLPSQEFTAPEQIALFKLKATVQVIAPKTATEDVLLHLNIESMPELDQHATLIMHANAIETWQNMPATLAEQIDSDNKFIKYILLFGAHDHSAAMRLLNQYCRHANLHIAAIKELSLNSLGMDFTDADLLFRAYQERAHLLWSMDHYYPYIPAHLVHTPKFILFEEAAATRQTPILLLLERNKTRVIHGENRMAFDHSESAYPYLLLNRQQDITWQRIHNIILEMPQPIDVLTLYQTLKQTELE